VKVVSPHVILVAEFAAGRGSRFDSGSPVGNGRGRHRFRLLGKAKHAPMSNPVRISSVLLTGRYIARSERYRAIAASNGGRRENEPGRRCEVLGVDDWGLAQANKLLWDPADGPGEAAR